MNNWIFASEMLPTDGERVLIYTEHEMYGKERYLKRDVATGTFKNGKWKCDIYIGNNVIAWMRLPEPPKGVL